MTSGERKVLAEALADLQAAGWTIDAVDNGDEWIKVDNAAERAIEEVDSVDESLVRVTRDGKRRTLFVVLGNASDGSEVISDHSVDLEAALRRYYAGS